MTLIDLDQDRDARQHLAARTPTQTSAGPVFVAEHAVAVRVRRADLPTPEERLELAKRRRSLTHQLQWDRRDLAELQNGKAKNGIVLTDAQRERELANAAARLARTTRDFDALDASLAADTLDLRDPARLTERCVVCEPVVDPDLHAALTLAGVSRRGARSFMVGVSTGDHASTLNKRLHRAVAVLPSDLIGTKHAVKEGLVHQGKILQGLNATLNELGAYDRPKITAIQGEGGLAAVPAAVTVEGSRQALWLRVTTRPRATGPLAPGGLLHRWDIGGALPSEPCYPDEAIEALAWARDELGWSVVDPDAIAVDLEALVRGGAGARGITGKPGLAVLVEGRPDGDPVKRTETTADHAQAVVAARRAAGDPVVIEGRVADAAAMAEALPDPDPALLGPQNEIVAAHLATEFGYLNCSDTGTGKSVVTLRAMRRKAQSLDGYRGLIVVKRPLVSKWVLEDLPDPGCGFPEAQVLALHEATARTAREILAADHAAGAQPLVVVASLEIARFRPEALCAITYDELIADEAAYLANPSTRVSRGMWKLRPRAQVAVALTATPVDKRTADLDPIVAWTRDDHDALKKRAAGREFRTADAPSMRKLHRAFGPAVQHLPYERMRRFMPDRLPPEHVMLDPTSAEAQLVHAAQFRVAELYRDLAAQVEHETNLRPDDPMLKEVARSMQSVRSLMMSALEDAIVASVDCEGLLESRSQSSALLASQGLIDQAVRKGPTQRQVIVDTVAECTQRDLPALVFAKRVRCLRPLVRDLNRSGAAHAGLLDGTLNDDERLELVDAFRAGRLNCLAIGAVGQEGLNLQAAAVAIHADLPWNPSALEQRVGRLVRIGSSHDAVRVLVPFMRTSAQEHVVSVLMPRAALAHAAKPGNAQIAAAQGAVTSQLASLAGELGAHEDASTVMKVCAQIYTAFADQLDAGVPAAA